MQRSSCSSSAEDVEPVSTKESSPDNTGIFDRLSPSERLVDDLFIPSIHSRTRASQSAATAKLLTSKGNTNREQNADDSVWISKSKHILKRRVSSINTERNASSKPQKLDPKIYERFEDQYRLVNWMASGISKHLKSQIADVDLKAISTAFCARLVSAGILRTHSDKDELGPQPDESFNTEGMYYWAPKDTSKILPRESCEESGSPSEKIQNLAQEKVLGITNSLGQR